MGMNAEQLRLIFGAKLRQLRNETDLTLSELAAKAALSISYLSEIEKGKKFPTPEKIIQIAQALGSTYDELVSGQVSESLDPLKTILNSPFIKEFPFELFGIKQHDLVNLVTNKPQEAGAFIRTLLEIGQSYDMSVEQFLFAALRSYQKLHYNYFEELEQSAEDFSRQHKLAVDPPLSAEALHRILTEEYNYEVGEIPLERHPELKQFRSICTPGKPKKLFLNSHLLPSQKAFLLARELGFCSLGLKEQPITSTWLEVESFDVVLNNFKASYFAGAMFINREMLEVDLRKFFQRESWDTNAFLNIMRKYEATPEMFLYRLSQLIPKFFGVQEMFYLRFNNEIGSKEFTLTKELNMSRVVVPHGMGLDEHYCRRWLSIRLLTRLGEMTMKNLKDATIAEAQRSRFVDNGVDFFVISVARPLALTQETNSSISLGFLVNENFKAAVHFWNDKAIPEHEVNETCERCSLPKSACKERVVPPSIVRKSETLSKRERALLEFLKSVA
jgi:XRE family transcriptional regulator, fatty acid utilization regulator